MREVVGRLASMWSDPVKLEQSWLGFSGFPGCEEDEDDLQPELLSLAVFENQTRGVFIRNQSVRQPSDHGCLDGPYAVGAGTDDDGWPIRR